MVRKWSWSSFPPWAYGSHIYALNATVLSASLLRVNASCPWTLLPSGCSQVHIPIAILAGLLASVPKPPCCLEWWHVVFHAPWHNPTGFKFGKVVILVLTRIYSCSLGPSSNSSSHPSSYRRCKNTAHLPKCGPEKQGQLSDSAWECMSSLPKVHATSHGSTWQLPCNYLQSEGELTGCDPVDTWWWY